MIRPPPAARLSQHACFDQHPEIFIAPYQYYRGFTAFRARFPKAELLVLPHARLKRDPDGLFSELFDALGVSAEFDWRSVGSANVTMPYKSWRRDKIIRWILVKLYGNREAKQLYKRPEAEKPWIARSLHALNKADYAWEPGAEERVHDELAGDYAAFIEAVTADPYCRLLGVRGDLA